MVIGLIKELNQKTSCQTVRANFELYIIAYICSMIKRTIILFCGFSHLFYGIIALLHPFYIAEFTRYGFGDYRVSIAIFQSLLGIGILLSFYYSTIGKYAALLLVLLMGGALATRIYIGDSVLQSLPAMVYLILNLYIFKSQKS